MRGSGRRQPQQERSRAKVEAILDAASAILVDQGEAGLTTTGVAERAGVAVGSLYQYFDSIDDIVDGVMARCADRFADRLELDLAGRTFGRKRDAANAALDCFIAFYRDEPVVRALRSARPLASMVGLDHGGERLLRVVSGAITAQGLASMLDVDYVLEAEVQWAVAESLVLLAFRRDPDGDPAVLHHLRRLFDMNVRPAAEVPLADDAAADGVVLGAVVPDR